MSIPSAIIFINSDLTDSLKQILAEQLNITETMTGTEFDARIVADPNYADVVYMQKIRILVVRDDYNVNTQYADVVIFYKQGLATILKNNLGPPGLSLPVARLNLYALLRYNGSNQVVILPATSTTNSGALGGIFALEGVDQSGVHSVNPDNEANNTDFVNRK